MNNTYFVKIPKSLCPSECTKTPERFVEGEDFKIYFPKVPGLVFRRDLESIKFENAKDSNFFVAHYDVNCAVDIRDLFEVNFRDNDLDFSITRQFETDLLNDLYHNDADIHMSRHNFVESFASFFEQSSVIEQNMHNLVLFAIMYNRKIKLVRVNDTYFFNPHDPHHFPSTSCLRRNNESFYMSPLDLKF